MSKKQDHRKKRASEKVFEKAEKHEGTSGEALKHERSSEKVEKLRLHGVITEGQLGEQINRSGLYPFTFKSSLLFLVGWYYRFWLEALEGMLGLLCSLRFRCCFQRRCPSRGIFLIRRGDVPAVFG